MAKLEIRSRLSGKRSSIGEYIVYEREDYDYYGSRPGALEALEQRQQRLSEVLAGVINLVNERGLVTQEDVERLARLDYADEIVEAE